MRRFAFGLTLIFAATTPASAETCEQAYKKIEREYATFYQRCEEQNGAHYPSKCLKYLESIRSQLARMIESDCDIDRIDIRKMHSGLGSKKDYFQAMVNYGATPNELRNDRPVRRSISCPFGYQPGYIGGRVGEDMACIRIPGTFGAPW